MSIIIQILILFLLTFIPLLELRLAIPVGILATTVSLPFNASLTGFNMNPWLVLFVCVLANAILGIFLYEFLFFIKANLKIFPKLNKFLDKFLNRAHKRLKPYVEKYGLIGIALFIAIPLPGTGSYTAALGSFILGISKKDFYIANAIGVAIAGILVTLITVGLINIF